ncbi:MAG: AAA family ATPase [Gammaproteobacteria bacterium]|nr:AAA family ATPase [Gammaproteobacteria bacterium]NNM00144.1 AAA family ATPase [Gammaproteobacteria bacterium]
MKKIVIVNTKGGSGKTTLATNLAGYFAWSGHGTCLVDYDSQGSSAHWATRRDEQLPAVQLTRAYQQNGRVTRSWALRSPPGVDRIVVDTPARPDLALLADLTGGASAMLVPVLPSEIDIHAASHCIGDLLLKVKVAAPQQRIAVVANRANERTNSYAALKRFLDTLQIPFIATLRDTQNYVHAAAAGCCIHELKGRDISKDIGQWEPLIGWLETRPDVAGSSAAGSLPRSTGAVAGRV